MLKHAYLNILGLVLFSLCIRADGASSVGNAPPAATNASPNPPPNAATTAAAATTKAAPSSAAAVTGTATATATGTGTGTATVTGTGTVSSTVSISFSPTPSLNPDSDCVQLSGSNTCDGLSNFRISRFLFNLTGSDSAAVSQFDSYINSWTSNNRIDALAGTLKCSAYNNFNASSIRYLRSYNCISAVVMSNWCNTAQTTIARPICNTMCWNLQDSLQSLFNDSSPYCSKDVTSVDTRGYQFTSMRTICSTYTWRQDSSTCLSGMSADASSCGFADSSQKQNYCSMYTSDPCCNSNTVSSEASGGNNKTVVIAVVASVLGSLFVAAFAGVFLFSRRHAAKAQDAEDAAISDETTAAKSSRNHIEPFKKARPYKVSVAYVPQLHDELHLSTGDHLIATGQLNTEWLYGQNLSTGQTGVFPVSNVRKYNIARARDSFLATTKNAKLRIMSAFNPGNIDVHEQANKNDTEAALPEMSASGDQKTLPEPATETINKENDMAASVESLGGKRDTLGRNSQLCESLNRDGTLKTSSPQLTPQMTPLMTPILPSMHNRRRSTASVSFSGNGASPQIYNSPLANSTHLPNAGSLSRRPVSMRPVSMMMMPNGYLVPLSLVEKDENGMPMVDGEIVNVLQPVDNSSDETLAESEHSDSSSESGHIFEEQEAHSQQPPLLP